MTANTGRRDLCQALFEGLALLTAEVVAALDAEVPVGPRLSLLPPDSGQCDAQNLGRGGLASSGLARRGAPP